MQLLWKNKMINTTSGLRCSYSFDHSQNPHQDQHITSLESESPKKHMIYLK